VTIAGQPCMVSLPSNTSHSTSVHLSSARLCSTVRYLLSLVARLTRCQPSGKSVVGEFAKMSHADQERFIYNSHYSRLLPPENQLPDKDSLFLVAALSRELVRLASWQRRQPCRPRRHITYQRSHILPLSLQIRARKLPRITNSQLLMLQPLIPELEELHVTQGDNTVPL